MRFNWNPFSKPTTTNKLFTPAISIPGGHSAGEEIAPEAERELGLSNARPTFKEEMTEEEKRRETFEQRIARINSEKEERFKRSAAWNEQRKQDAIDEALFSNRPKHKRVILPAERVYGQPPLSVAFLSTLGAKISADDRAYLTATGEAYAKLRKFMEEFFDDKISPTLRAEESEHRATLLRGEVPKQLPRTYEKVREQNRANIQIILREMKRLSDEARPVLCRLCLNVLSVAKSEAGKLETAERAAHTKTGEKYGWDFVPSQLLAVLQQIEHRLPQFVPLKGVDSGNPITAARSMGFEI